MKKISNKAAQLIVAHVNDTHSYFEPTSLQLSLEINGEKLSPYVSAGGFARIATRLEQLKQDAKRMQKGFLFLHSGDCFQGTLYFSLFKGRANADLLNALNPHAMTLGNHELDMGNEPVGQFVNSINFPLLAGNWDLTNELSGKEYPLKGKPNVLDYDSASGTAKWITHLVNEEPIAIFGLSIDKMADIANPDSDTPFVNATETARKTVELIRSNGINKIILLSHLGYEGDLQLAEDVEGISLIVGGHSHRLQGDFDDIGLGKDDEYGIKVNDTHIVQSGCHALTLGHCAIYFDEHGKVTSFQGRNELLLGRRLFLNADMSETGDDEHHEVACEYLNAHQGVVVCKKDPTLTDLLRNKYQNKVRELQQKVIAKAEANLYHTRIPDEKGPSIVAPLVAESFYYCMKQLGHDVDFAIHNAGGVRKGIEIGELTVADIAGKLLPFAVPIGVYQITGRVLQLTLEGAINNAINNGFQGTGSGSYPYVYNLKFDYHADKPAGERISELYLRNTNGEWNAVESDKVYRGTSSAYTMKGKEGYEALLEVVGENKVSNLSMADCFIKLLSEHPQKLTSANIQFG
ncbi:bifunctional metallophosphatase/5'-nucleotidase [Vibrio sonorensis]|uniref:bifunctional metallophosphatase/5'-nucleotidase n=1 Tax=Vibrio sonorensis TaxID=1004316 RepID=UPI0008D95DF9|nr:bifunctional UDP-sugar hydrolase/5'-nucleotidase [Vibrio sonorensis]